MSMSTCVEAIRPPNEKWKKMKVAYDACKAAGAGIPDDVDDFFNGEPPDDRGVVVCHVSKYDKELPDWVTKVDKEMQEGFEIDISKLPRDVTVLRFTNSY